MFCWNKKEDNTAEEKKEEVNENYGIAIKGGETETKIIVTEIYSETQGYRTGIFKKNGSNVWEWHPITQYVNWLLVIDRTDNRPIRNYDSFDYEYMQAIADKLKELNGKESENVREC